MSCGYSKPILALYVEDDLPTPEAVEKVAAHVEACPECKRYCDQLRVSQSFIKSRFKAVTPESVSQDVLADIRRSVMSQIEPVRQSMGWAVRLERFILLGLKRPRFVAVAFAIVAIISATQLSQIQSSAPTVDHHGPVFAANNALLCPTDYREWVFVGSCDGHWQEGNESSQSYNVYINPVAYREYTRSGKFPDGTVMALEALSADMKRAGLEVSVKDSSRFESGWGFYDFTGEAGTVKPEAGLLPQTAGCVSCHRDRAANDHVFTQFYPALRTGTAKL